MSSDDIINVRINLTSFILFIITNFLLQSFCQRFKIFEPEEEELHVKEWTSNPYVVNSKDFIFECRTGAKMRLQLSEEHSLRVEVEKMVYVRLRYFL